MKKYIKILLENLFDDDDDIFLDTELDGGLYSLISKEEEIAEIAIEHLLKGEMVSKAELSAACNFPYIPENRTELLTIISNISNKLSLNSAFSVNWINIKNIDDLSYIFSALHNHKLILWDCSNWDTEHVKNMSGMFLHQHEICDIRNFNTRNVELMSGMFTNCTEFDMDLSNWDVSSVKNFSSMFKNASKFNGNISNWKTDSAENMREMFSGAINFNLNIKSWNVSNVTNMQGMFYNAKNFNKDISHWKLKIDIPEHKAGLNLTGMFNGAINFNQPILKWNISCVTYFDNFLYHAVSFKQDLSSWDLRGKSYDDFISSTSGLSRLYKYMPRMIGPWDFVLQAYKDNTYGWNLDGFEIGDGADDGSYAKLDYLYIDPTLENVSETDLEVAYDDMVYAEGQEPDTWEHSDCITLSSLKHNDIEAIYNYICSTNCSIKNDGTKIPDITILIKSALIDYYYNNEPPTPELIDSNKEYYINKGLNIIGMDKDEFNEIYSDTEFLEMFKTVKPEVDKEVAAMEERMRLYKEKYKLLNNE